MSAIALAHSLLQSGNVAGAIHILKESADPGPERDYLLGRCMARQGDAAGAIASFSAVLARDPRHVEAALALGAQLVRQGWLDKAEAHYSKSLKKVDDDRLRVGLAVVCWSRNQQARALQELGRVISRSPDDSGARMERATMLTKLERFDEAATDLRQIIEREPGRIDVLNFLGMLEFKVGRYTEALPLLREAYRREPDNGVAIYNYGATLIFLGAVDEGGQVLERLRTADPSRWKEFMASTADSRVVGTDDFDPRPLFLLVCYKKQMLCEWALRERFKEVFHDFIRDPRNSRPIRLAHCAGIIELAAAERRRLMELAGTVAAGNAVPFQHAPSPAPTRLRVGYVLTRLGIHVVAKVLRQLLASLDPEQVELHVVTVLQQQMDAGSGVPESYLAIPGLKWIDVSGMDDQGAAERLHAERFDILVDLALYNDGGRPGIFARRPAPVQVNFLGAPFTSGVPWMDYIITDPVVSPGIPGWCSEAEAQMPECFFTYGWEGARPEVPARRDFGVPVDAFVYSGLNNPYKIDPSDFDRWMRILVATPGSILMLRDDEDAQCNLRLEAERRGVDPARLLFAPVVSHEQYLQRQGMPDLFLDTCHYGAHTTMAESLWMGVPALTRPGDAFPSRVGASLLASCGLQELVMPDWEAYEATAIALYHDRDRLRRLKETLLASRDRAAPFDMPRQARNMERAFRHMRERFAQGLPPETFRVGDLPD